MNNGRVPYVHPIFDTKWSWSWRRFGLGDENPVFTTLHKRFNLRTSPIQDPEAFFLDVRECAEASANVDELYERIAERQKERISELEQAWKDTVKLMRATKGNWECRRCQRLASGDDSMEDKSENDPPIESLFRFSNMVKSMSLDSMVRYFDGFVRDARKTRDDERRKREEKYAAADRELAEEAREREKNRLREQNQTNKNSGYTHESGNSTADSTAATGSDADPVSFADAARSPAISTSPEPDVEPTGAPAEPTTPARAMPKTASSVGSETASDATSPETLATTPSPSDHEPRSPGPVNPESPAPTTTPPRRKRRRSDLEEEDNVVDDESKYKENTNADIAAQRGRPPWDKKRCLSLSADGDGIAIGATQVLPIATQDAAPAVPPKPKTPTRAKYPAWVLALGEPTDPVPPEDTWQVDSRQCETQWPVYNGWL